MGLNPQISCPSYGLVRAGLVRAVKQGLPQTIIQWDLQTMDTILSTTERCPL